MSEESDLQKEFVRCIGLFIAWCYANGYQLTFGEAFRTMQQAAWDAAHGSGIAHSGHTRRLAVDFNLFINGEYQTDSDAYKPLGDFWKTLHPLARWGGTFKKPDGNHFSFEFNGVQ